MARMCTAKKEEDCGALDPDCGRSRQSAPVFGGAERGADTPPPPGIDIDQIVIYRVTPADDGRSARRRTFTYWTLSLTPVPS